MSQPEADKNKFLMSDLAYRRAGSGLRQNDYQRIPHILQL
jgi:hypothetical protein